ncbi:O-antigen ligase family protein [Vibrio intestinalis]|uniref:O-antigen ligase family protein n=1 Tax=Vibrio intestinalis TaxID=2933291 RepID=UPI0021A2C930|nr:O-antigen ligase family protein [Vibrio intestinalis]
MTSPVRAAQPSMQVKNSKHAILILLICAFISCAWFIIPNPVIVVALALLPLGALFVVNQTFWFVSLFVLFSFFRIHEAFSVLYSLKIPLLLSLGALAGLSWHILISRSLKVYWHSSLTWMALFWLLVIIGIVFASNRGMAVASFKGIYWKIIIMTLAITWLVNSQIMVKRMSLMIVITGILISSVALFNSVSGIGLVEGSRVTIGRDLGSMLGDPNDLALVLMFPLAFAVSLTMTKQLGFVRVIGLICTVAAMAAVIATQSRGGLLGSLAVFGMFGLKYIRSKVLLFTLAVIAAGLLFALAGISDRQSGGAAEEGIDASAMGRIYAWQAAFKMALENPLTGVGLDNFYVNYFYYSPHWDGLNHAVHSTWFGVLAETGFVGLAVFVGLIISLLRTSRTTISKLAQNPTRYSLYLHANVYAVYAGLIGVIVSGTFLTQGFNWPLYILAALAISSARIVQNHSQNENQNKHIKDT